MTKFVVRMDVTVDLDVDKAQEVAHPFVEAGFTEHGLAPDRVVETPTEAADYVSQEPRSAVSAALVRALTDGIHGLFGEKVGRLDATTTHLPGGDMPPPSGS